MNVFMQQKIKLYIILMATLMLAGQFPAQAENWGGRSSRKHEVRIGWGDQMFEKLVWQNPQYIISNMPETAFYQYKEHYRYSQHWFAEYQWRVNQWFGLGAMVDASGCVWDDVTRNGLGKETDRIRNRNFWNLTVMPVLRFTWFNMDFVSMYSALGVGLGINGGTETDALGRHTLCAMAFDIAPVGIAVNVGNWFVSAEVGGLYSLKGKAQIFMANSRLCSVSFGIWF